MCCSIERAAMVQESQSIEVRTPNLQKANPTRHEPSRRKCRRDMRSLLKFMRGPYSYVIDFLSLSRISCFRLTSGLVEMAVGKD
jgi:hypothetical protein